MMRGRNPVDLETVLDSFALEKLHDKPTLERYLRTYPQFAGELIDLSLDIAQPDQIDDSSLSSSEIARIDAAWLQHVAVQPLPANSLAHITVEQSRELAQALRVPRQVIGLFQDGLIIQSSVPTKFMRRLTKLISQWQTQLQSQHVMRAAPSFKADGKPGQSKELTFEAALIEADVPAEERAQLMAEDGN